MPLDSFCVGKYSIERTTGGLVHVDDVPNGLACGCVCPACRQPLVAKNGGSKRDHHFAHYHTGTSCVHGYETSLHLLAKEILSEEGKIYLPAVTFKRYEGTQGVNERAEVVVSSPAGPFVFDSASIERRIAVPGEGGGDLMVPDVVLRKRLTDGSERELLVEIFVTNKVAPAKRELIRRAGVSAVEVDLSGIDRHLERDELRAILLEGSDLKEWIWNGKVARAADEEERARRERRHRFERVQESLRAKIEDTGAVELASVRRGASWLEYPCPLSSELTDVTHGYWCTEQGECDECEHSIILTGYKRFCAARHDLKASLEAGRCPECGAPLRRVHGKYGEFTGCSGYPSCRFTFNDGGRVAKPPDEWTRSWLKRGMDGFVPEEVRGYGFSYGVLYSREGSSMVVFLPTDCSAYQGHELARVGEIAGELGIRRAVVIYDLRQRFSASEFDVVEVDLPRICYRSRRHERLISLGGRFAPRDPLDGLLGIGELSDVSAFFALREPLPSPMGHGVVIEGCKPFGLDGYFAKAFSINGAAFTVCVDRLFPLDSLEPLLADSEGQGESPAARIQA